MAFRLPALLRHPAPLPPITALEGSEEARSASRRVGAAADGATASGGGGGGGGVPESGASRRQAASRRPIRVSSMVEPGRANRRSTRSVAVYARSVCSTKPPARRTDTAAPAPPEDGMPPAAGRAPMLPRDAPAASGGTAGAAGAGSRNRAVSTDSMSSTALALTASGSERRLKRAPRVEPSRLERRSEEGGKRHRGAERPGERHGRTEEGVGVPDGLGHLAAQQEQQPRQQLARLHQREHRRCRKRLSCRRAASRGQIGRQGEDAQQHSEQSQQLGAAAQARRSARRQRGRRQREQQLQASRRQVERWHGRCHVHVERRGERRGHPAPYRSTSDGGCADGRLPQQMLPQLERFEEAHAAARQPARTEGG
eukprot:jgi/Chrpa1/21962/Chrysochromulina_OHIO_Genome00007327-RA